MKKSAFLTLLTATTAGLVLALPARADDDKPQERMRVKVVDRVDCPDVQGADGALGMKVVKRGFLGVELTGLTPELRGHFGVPQDEGVMIGKIVDDSAAFRAGLEVGDILTRVDGETVEGSWDVSSAIRDRRGGDTVTLEYWRGGEVRQVSVALGERKTCSFDFSAVASSLEDLGKTLPELQLQGLQISEEALEEVMESLRGINWEEHIHKLENIEIEKIDVRMEELQERMEALGERLEREGVRLDEEHLQMHHEKLRKLEQSERRRIEREVEVRRELTKARSEAQRARAEAAQAATEARHEAHQAARAESEAQREVEREARREAERMLREAEREAERAAREAEQEAEGGGGPI